MGEFDFVPDIEPREQWRLDDDGAFSVAAWNAARIEILRANEKGPTDDADEAP